MIIGGYRLRQKKRDPGEGLVYTIRIREHGEHDTWDFGRSALDAWSASLMPQRGQTTFDGTCYACGIRKPLSEFESDRTRPSGCSHRCKLCSARYRKARRESALAANQERERTHRSQYAADPDRQKRHRESRESELAPQRYRGIDPGHRRSQLDSRRPERVSTEELSRRIAAALKALGNKHWFAPGDYNAVVHGAEFPGYPYSTACLIYGVAVAAGYDAAITTRYELVRRNWGRPHGVAS